MARQGDGGQAWDKRMRAIGHGIVCLERLAEGLESAELQLTAIKFKLDADNGTSVLAVLTSVVDGVEHVAFVGGYQLSDVVLAIRRKMQRGALRWRESVPWEQ